MNYSDLKSELDTGGVVLIDGATGTEIERRGVVLSEDAWSATGALHLHGQDIVRSVHESYLDVGARIVISNTFSTSWQALVNAGLVEHFESLNHDGVDLARQAINRTDAHALVAGGISHWFWSGPAPTLDELDRTVTHQAEIMRDAGADLLMLEMMVDIDMTLTQLRAAQRSGLPVWVGFSTRVDPDGSVKLLDGIPLAEGVDAVAGEDIDLISIMHTDVEAIEKSLKIVVEHWSGHLGAYAHSGRWEDPEWIYGPMSEATYACEAAKWLDLGVQVIGGCCGTGPEHIRALGDMLQQRPH